MSEQLTGGRLADLGQATETYLDANTANQAATGNNTPANANSDNEAPDAIQHFNKVTIPRLEWASKVRFRRFGTTKYHGQAKRRKQPQ
jgi:hypothetical protein